MPENNIPRCSKKAGLCLVILFYISFMLFLGVISKAYSKEQNILTVSVLIYSVEQRNALEEIGRLFQKQFPNTKVIYISADGEQYKSNMQRWLEHSDTIDVMHWAWPEYLKENARKGFIEPLTDLWQSTEIKNNFSSMLKDLVTVNGHQYGMPYSSAVWGIYYRKSVFKQLNLPIPTNWDEFIHACEVLKKSGMIPIAIGTSERWPSASWFDYLNLRLNGLEFHQQLVAGDVSFTSAKVRRVFTYWKTLIDNNYFLKGADTLSLKQVIPLLYRKRAGMVLSGSFMVSQLSPQFKNDMSYFRFPIIEPSIPLSEEVPTNIFIVSKNSKDKRLAKQFLRFISSPNIIELLNEQIEHIAPIKNADANSNGFTQKGIEIMKDSQGFSQYFDRDAPDAFANPALTILTNFIESGDVDSTINALEKLRLTVFTHKKND